ncbi:MAG: penicillin amidase [Limisphaerales bacterium]|jgi:penicillin amidase
MGLLENIIERGLGWYIRRANRLSLKATNGAVKIPELSGRAEALIDKWGVPHIYADDIHDLVRAQGYLHCRHRLFQMDLSRRVATGTLSEWLGEPAVDTDRLVRTVGLHILAEQDLKSFAPEEMMLIEAYAEGVNAGIAAMGNNLPSEYKLLRVKARQWTAKDTCAISRLMTWQMSRGWYHELVRTWIIEKAGDQIAEELDLHYKAPYPIGLPDGLEFNELMDEGMLKAANGPFLGQHGGSNAWTVSGTRTASGNAILSNDPHLPMGLPSIWFENHLCSKEVEVTGVSVPGVPLVVIGHNRNIAWGVTLAYLDAEDLVTETFDKPKMYHTPSGIKEVEIRTEQIKVKDRPDFIEQVVSTENGPLLSAHLNHLETGGNNLHLALCSRALQPSKSILTFFKLNLAENWNDFVDAMKCCVAPPLNIVYADNKGNTGYWVTGEIATRKGGITGLPADGKTGRGIWDGVIPFEEMPHSLNPSKGYILSCNNKVINEEYPHDLGNIWMLGNRALSAEQYLSQNKTLTIEDCMTMQNDLHSKAVGLYQQLYSKHKTNDKLEQKVLDKLLNWDGILTSDSSSAAVYSVLKRTLTEVLLKKSFGSQLKDKILGAGLHPVMLSFSEFYSRESEYVPRILNSTDSVLLWQAGGKEYVLATALKQTASSLQATFSSIGEEWSWGSIHNISFRHPLSVKAPLDKIYNLGPHPLGGDSDTLAQAGYVLEFDKEMVSASWRQIIDTGDWSKSVSVLSPGNSGMLEDEDYDSQLDMWLKGKYKPMLWTRAEIEASTKQVLLFRA